MKKLGGSRDGAGVPKCMIRGEIDGAFFDPNVEVSLFTGIQKFPGPLFRAFWCSWALDPVQAVRVTTSCQKLHSVA